MKKFILWVLLFLTITQAVSAQQSTTVWTPGINYSLTYAQDIHIEFANVTLNQANLPTSFNVTDLNNTGYRYVLQGDQEEKSVNMEIFNFPNLGSFELPVGDLPIFLPISFNGKEDWMDSFGSELQILGGILNDLNESAFFATNITITNSDISFSIFSNFEELAFSNISQDISSYLQFLPDLVFEKEAVFKNVILSTNISYSKTSGIMEFLSIDFLASNATVNNITYFDQKISQLLTFAAVLPPFGSSGLFESPYSLLGSVAIIPILIIRKRRRI